MRIYDPWHTMRITPKKKKRKKHQLAIQFSFSFDDGDIVTDVSLNGRTIAIEAQEEDGQLIF